MNKIALVSTLHDPQASMAPILSACLPLLPHLYVAVEIIATPTTAPLTLALLADGGATVTTDGNEHIGLNRRQALGRGLAHRPVTHCHYCDFDRLLFWLLHQPDELRRVLGQVVPQADYLAIGRTPTAFATHPHVQQELEGLTNDLFSGLVGEEMDVTAGSCAVSVPAGHYLLQHSRELSNATDTEWPMLIKMAPAGFQLAYMAVDGLAFETAFFHGPQIYAQADQPANWAKRTRLARQSVAAALRLWTNAPPSL